MPVFYSPKEWKLADFDHQAIWGLGFGILFAIYVIGISGNPPAFYVDESGLAYNAFLVSQTGGGEFGPKWPLFFQLFTGGFTQYSNPTQIYLLSVVFWIFGPGILKARLFATICVFGACILLGALAGKISGRRITGTIIGICSLLTPWLFEVGRLVLETFFYPMALVLFLWAVYFAHKKEKWTWINILSITATLLLLTYSYTIGRVLAPLLALGMICFIKNRNSLFAVVKSWLAYAVTLIPLIVFNSNNPGLTTRFYLISYIKPDSSWSESFFKFVPRFFEDLSLSKLLLRGDLNPRHHIPDALGSFYFAAFVLVIIGLGVIIAKHRRNRWWWFVIFGTLVSVIPGAMTVDVFHTFRMIAYPIFLLLLMVPAVEWLIGPATELNPDKVEEECPQVQTSENRVLGASGLKRFRLSLLIVLFITLLSEASFFHYQYYTRGPIRGYIFDAAYKDLYDEAVLQPLRPIYLVDGYWGPAYIHSFWYATVEGRNREEFTHQPYGVPPPPGFHVISSDRDCTSCEIIMRRGDYILYRSQ